MGPLLNRKNRYEPQRIGSLDKARFTFGIFDYIESAQQNSVSKTLGELPIGIL